MRQYPHNHRPWMRRLQAQAETSLKETHCKPHNLGQQILMTNLAVTWAMEHNAVLKTMSIVCWMGETYCNPRPTLLFWLLPGLPGRLARRLDPGPLNSHSLWLSHGESIPRDSHRHKVWVANLAICKAGSSLIEYGRAGLPNRLGKSNNSWQKPCQDKPFSAVRAFLSKWQTPYICQKQ
jgi:hypothetical protein